MIEPKVRPEGRCPKCGNKVTRGGANRGVQRYRCRDRKVCSWHGCNPAGLEDVKAAGIDRNVSVKLHKKVSAARGGRRYVITAAQNATPVHEAFLKSLLTYCKENRAQLLVIPYRYKNPTSMWTERAKEDDWWAPELSPFILAERTQLGREIVVLADIMTQPTATVPLQGFETLVGGKSAIIGHPKLELMVVPTPQHKLPKLLTTTGAVTLKNYVQAKAGKKAEHHHTFGACALEIDGDMFHVRQLNALDDDGSFMDLNYEYRPSGRTKVERAAGLVMGDTHAKFVDPGVVAATWGPGGMVEILKPQTLVWHDIHDGFSHNHWHDGQLVTNLVKHQTGNNDIENELRGTFGFLYQKTRPDTDNVIVDSNHPRWLSRWLNTVNPRYDLQNVVFWAKTLQMVAETARMGEGGVESADPFVLWGKQMLPAPTLARTKFLGPNESHLIKGIEVGMHGDRGANGAKGSPKTFAHLGVKSVTGDGHSPWIKEGAYRVGTSTLLRLQYTQGPSSWLHTHCVIYANGKRSLLNIINGKWRA